MRKRHRIDNIDAGCLASEKCENSQPDDSPVLWIEDIPDNVPPFRYQGDFNGGHSPVLDDGGACDNDVSPESRGTWVAVQIRCQDDSPVDITNIDTLTRHVGDLLDALQELPSLVDTVKLNAGMFDSKQGAMSLHDIVSRTTQMMATIQNIPDTEELAADISALRSVLSCAFYAFMALSKQSSLRNGVMDATSDILLELQCDESLFSQLKSHQKAERMLLHRCYLSNYRRLGVDLYAPRNTSEGIFTHSYVRVSSVAEFVYEQTGMNTALYSLIRGQSGTLESVRRYLENCQEPSLPTLRQKRTIFSFRNGVYDAEENKFYTFGGLDHRSARWHPCVAAKYHDFEFDWDLYRQYPDPIDIPTPSVSTIFESQNFSEEVSRIIYASLGRLVFDVRQMDNFQYVPFFKGQGGTGKSTLLNLLMNFYSHSDIGNLQSEHGSQTFPLEHIYDKYIYTCMDVAVHHSLGQTAFFSMVCGEEMAVNRKHKTPWQGPWTAPGAFASNHFPPFADWGGNVTRRFLVVQFNPVAVEDTGLEYRCKQEIAPFLMKCVSLYHQLRDRVNRINKSSQVQHGIYARGVLPEYFHDTKMLMARHVNALCAFLSSPKCMIHNERGTLLHIFQGAFDKFCRDGHRMMYTLLAQDFNNKDVQRLARLHVESNTQSDGQIVERIVGVGLTNQ